MGKILCSFCFSEWGIDTWVLTGDECPTCGSLVTIWG